MQSTNYFNPVTKPRECSYSTQGVHTCEVTPTTNVIYPDGRPLFFMERFANSEPQPLKESAAKPQEGLDAYFTTPLQYKPDWMRKC